MTTHISTTAGQLTIAVHAAAACGLTLDDALTMPPDALRARIASAFRTQTPPTPAQETQAATPSDEEALAAIRALRAQLKQS